MTEIVEVPIASAGSEEPKENTPAKIQELSENKREISENIQEI